MSTILTTSFGEGLKIFQGRLSSAKGGHRSEELKSHWHHGGCGERVRYGKRHCDAGHPVEYRDIVDGFTVDGRTIIPSKDDWANINDPITHELAHVCFVDLSKLNRILLNGDSYWWDPLNQPSAIDAYNALREGLAIRDVGSIVRFRLRTRAQLGLLEPDQEGGLIVHTLAWPDEIRQRTYVAGGPAKDKVVGEVLDWVDSSMGMYGVGDGFVDDGAEQLRELLLTLAAVPADDPVAAVEAADVSDKPVDLDTDLMAALKASIKKAPAKPRRTRKKVA